MAVKAILTVLNIIYKVPIFTFFIYITTLNSFFYLQKDDKLWNITLRQTRDVLKNKTSNFLQCIKFIKTFYSKKINVYTFIQPIA